MTSYQFEKAAKNAVAKVVSEKHGVKVALLDLQLVWFAHVLGSKKALLWCPGMGKRYAEATYNAEKDELYIDIYVKESNTCIEGNELNFEA